MLSFPIITIHGCVRFESRKPVEPRLPDADVHRGEGGYEKKGLKPAPLAMVHLGVLALLFNAIKLLMEVLFRADEAVR